MSVTPDIEEGKRPQLTVQQIDALLDNLKVVESMKKQIDRITIELAIVRSQQSQVVNSGKEETARSISRTREGNFNASRKQMLYEKVDNDVSDCEHGKNEPADIEQSFHDAIEEVPNNVDNDMKVSDGSDADNAIIPGGNWRYSSLYQCGFAGIKYAKSSFMGRRLSNEKEGGELEQDLFTTMMLYPPIVAFRSFTTSRREGASTVRRYPCFRISKVWMLGLLAFMMEMTLGLLVLMDQVIDMTWLQNSCGPMRSGGLCGASKGIRFKDSIENLFSVPLTPNTLVQIAQGITIPLALVSQTDIATSMRTIYQLRNIDGNDWHGVIKVDQNHRTKWTWFVRILLPNFFKFTEALVILFACWVLIVQSESIVDLLKDFSALMVISSIDNVLFIMAENGFFGKDLLNSTKEAKGVNVDNSAFESRSGCFIETTVLLILSTMLASWGVLMHRQNTGYYFKAKYPKCPMEIPHDAFITFAPQTPAFHLYHNGLCDSFMNNAECDFDGGDCETFDKVYPGCRANYEALIGNGVCNDDTMYNSYECHWDGGDCVKDNYPDCNVSNENVSLIGNKRCDIAYNTTACEYDGRDCLGR